MPGMYGLLLGLMLISVMIACATTSANSREVPDAAAVLRQQQPPVLDLPPDPPPPLQTEPSTLPPFAEAPGLHFVFNGFRITGETAFSEDELLKLVGDLVGQVATNENTLLPARTIAR